MILFLKSHPAQQGLSRAALPVNLVEGQIRRNPGEPSQQQAKTDNYNKPRIQWNGLTIAIENPAGSVRRGATWEVRMCYDYGEIVGSMGMDGDPVDVYMGPNLEAPMVYVVHQRRVGDWAKYDEDKCMLGFDCEEDAKAAFLSNYNDPRFLGPVSAIPVAQFVSKVLATRKAPAMVKALGLVLFIKSQLSLFDAPVTVQAHVRKDGVVVRPHVRMQKIIFRQPSLFDVVPSREATKTDKVAQAVQAAEDREDLADALVADPHSEASKNLLLKLADGISASADPEPVGADDPNSPHYRYADTGYIAGSRKELVSKIIAVAKKSGLAVHANQLDWGTLEKNPREAKELINKSNLFGEVNWEQLKAGGMAAETGYLIDRVYASIGQSPSSDNAQARQDYTLGLETLRSRLEACKTPLDVTNVLDELRKEYDGTMLTAQESIEYSAKAEQANAIWADLGKIRDTKEALYKTSQNHSHSAWTIQKKISQRAARGWQPDPDLNQDLQKIQAQVDQSMQAVQAESKRAEPVVAALQAQLTQLRKECKTITHNAVARNKQDNPLHRAWSLMGERFVGVLRYRSSQGSGAFRGHVTAAKSGTVAGWSWAEKESKQVPRATKESVRFQLKVADSSIRVGGREVQAKSTMELKNTFGLRDVQSGNWVLRDVASAKFHTTQAAAAFADLADLIGAKDSEVSLNGRLALAFGARGNGLAGARAHYEPVHRVINITKMQGGGALAHEWFHALDNMVKEMEGGAGAGSASHDYATETPNVLPEGPLRDAFANLNAAMLKGGERSVKNWDYSALDVKRAELNVSNSSSSIAQKIKNASNATAAVEAIEQYFEPKHARALTPKEKKRILEWSQIAVAHHGGNPQGGNVAVSTGKPMSQFYRDAIALDCAGNKTANVYYSKILEMGARAFQAWTEDKLESQGRRNDYLSALANNKHYADSDAASKPKPFPEGDERKRINQAFDRLFGVLAASKTLAKALRQARQVDRQKNKATP